MWTLVFIVFVGQDITAIEVGTYKTMFACFEERAVLSKQYGKGNGYFNVDSQAICIQRELGV